MYFIAREKFSNCISNNNTFVFNYSDVTVRVKTGLVHTW